MSICLIASTELASHIEPGRSSCGTGIVDLTADWSEVILVEQKCPRGYMSTPALVKVMEVNIGEDPCSLKIGPSK